MDNDNELNEPEVIANKFNEFFVNVGPNLAKNFNKNSDEFYKYLEGNYENSMFLNYTTSEEVNRVTDNLVGKNSCGIDEISCKIIKYVAPFISIPLSHIFNLSFETGKIPEQLKTALVRPVYKSSDTDKFSNYRPISVLPCFSKVLEQIMYNRLTSYIEKNGIRAII